ncbi:CIC11C00000004796 [Sungouiella intermedia]|uniref:CIC11C00000004796 n=1 Tax=Sungouiella intermedia TaxID=45354 RepID=A0A1L0C438_9ASCO|nr:CIC11C00000004796 [[Candida] intermedia]SGZ58369.1 CIC11C00000005498 [[Candida] intermedia]
MDESELNAIRAARLAELQKNQSQSASSGADELKLTVLSQVLEPSARERLSRVRIVRPDRAEQVEQYLMKLIQMGSITRKLGENDIVEILESLSRDEKKQTKIVYERRGTEDDEDDDFFD